MYKKSGSNDSNKNTKRSFWDALLGRKAGGNPGYPRSPMETDPYDSPRSSPMSTDSGVDSVGSTPPRVVPQERQQQSSEKLIEIGGVTTKVLSPARSLTKSPDKHRQPLSETDYDQGLRSSKRLAKSGESYPTSKRGSISQQEGVKYAAQCATGVTNTSRGGNKVSSTEELKSEIEAAIKAGEYRAINAPLLIEYLDKVTVDQFLQTLKLTNKKHAEEHMWEHDSAYINMESFRDLASGNIEAKKIIKSWKSPIYTNELCVCEAWMVFLQEAYNSSIASGHVMDGTAMLSSSMPSNTLKALRDSDRAIFGQIFTHLLSYFADSKDKLSVELYGVRLDGEGVYNMGEFAKNNKAWFVTDRFGTDDGIDMAYVTVKKKNGPELYVNSANTIVKSIVEGGGIFLKCSTKEEIVFGAADIAVSSTLNELNERCLTTLKEHDLFSRAMTKAENYLTICYSKDFIDDVVRGSISGIIRSTVRQIISGGTVPDSLSAAECRVNLVSAGSSR